MQKFKVNAKNVVLLNKDGKSVVLNINTEHNVEDYDFKDLMLLATNSRPLILSALEKKTGRSNISFTDENFLKAVKDVSDDFKSSIEFLDAKMPEKETKTIK
jgi:hypothetical protein